MKYKAISDFNSHRFGTVKSGDTVEVTEDMAKQMISAGLIEANKEAKKEAKKETKAKKTK